ncbi:hypothetical protein C9I92_02590 [Photobacterium ganghwense]|uniref:Lipoprotein n=1 Tax=Photobacterium ganghwense TaxID=320778 RepID=A0A0J1HGS7_9GAMM|nr:DUF6279 family lipoprotein [Photobacterium ganghwense]KLV10809.1 hypothetical protein ABT57_05020 [Photobacterium ganghwense]PSU11017.1 hypothetical protein C9I92_02590 [Photobacterium ganghwense]QSV13121.1 hypothetical protein FH974_10205 [Photobacterium ganghwense]
MARQRHNNSRFSILLLLLVIILAGCTTRLAYNNLDWWLVNRVSDYVTLTRQQQLQLDTDLERALERHRRQELPKIHRAIDALQADLKSPVTFAQMQHYYTLFTGLSQDSAQVLATPLAAMLSQLDESQIAQIEINLRKKFQQADREREGKSRAQKIAKRTERLADFTDNWIGSVSSSQKTLLAELAGYQIEMEPVFIAMRDDYFKRWQQLMTERKQAGFNRKLAGYLRDATALNTTTYRGEMDLYLKRRFELLRRLQHTLSGKQNAFLNDKLVDLRKDIAVLIHQ